MQKRYLVFALVVFSFFLLQPAGAQWSTDPNLNNAICPATNGQTNPTIVSDGSGGAIITWQDSRSGNHIYAQRINASGTLQWTASGVAVCTAIGTQQFPTIVSDGSGGAIITWQDFRGGNNDIYAQRITASGAVQWTADGVAICTATGDQPNPMITSDGSGGAIITWQDARGANNDIYAQRIRADGVTLWTADGVVICSATNDQFIPTIVNDGSGGAIITWTDNRSGNFDIYAQRINASGTVQWNANGIAICTAAGFQYTPMIVSNASGGAVITWTDARGANNDIYAQRIDASGAVQWTADGVVICSAASDQYLPMIVNDGSGGAIITWQDGRSVIEYDIYAQRINASGTVQWTANGVAISTATYNQVTPTITNDGSGGAIITWQDGRSGTYDIFAQRINASGTVQWTVNGVAICTATNDQLTPTITNDGTGGAIITWQDSRSGNHIYAQRVDRLGNLYPAPWIDKVGDIANDQGGKLRILWKPSNLDAWGNTTVKSYTIKMGAKATGLLGKTAQTTGDGIYWQTAGSVPADWSNGYSMVTTTYADSGLQGVPHYYFQVIAKNADSTVYWSSNIDSGYSVDNIPPVGVSGSTINSGSGGSIVLTWNKDRVDPDVMGYRVYRSPSSGFLLVDSTLLALSIDTTYTDAATNLGETYYYRVATVDVHGNQGTPSGQLSETALSITLSSFSATASRLNVELQWTSATETNNYGYEIQRSLANVSESAWQDIGFVAGAGTSNAPKDYSFTDRNLSAVFYDYRLKQIDRSGNFHYSQSVEVEVGVAPKVFELSQNFPNPFNPATNIEFTVPTNGRAVLKVFNAIGQEVATLFNDEAVAGTYHQVQFSAEGGSASGGNASHFASGMYFARLEFDGKVQLKKMLFIK
jgi:fibronectin type 3 domain-containing protein